MKCKYCGCSEATPCLTPVVVNVETGDGRLALRTSLLLPNERLQHAPCSWLMENVCTAPACVEKAYLAISMSAAINYQLAAMHAMAGVTA